MEEEKGRKGGREGRRKGGRKEGRKKKRSPHPTLLLTVMLYCFSFKNVS
jgi:hypothetical protein